MTSAEAADREAIAEIGALGERELAAVKAWVASGCEGPQPRPDAEARRVLTERLMAAMAAREAAEMAVSGRSGADGSVARSDGEMAATGRLCGAARAA